VFILHGTRTIVPPFGQYAYYGEEEENWGVPEMTTSEFFIILGTVYLAPSMNSKLRDALGMFFIAVALIMEFVKWLHFGYNLASWLLWLYMWWRWSYQSYGMINSVGIKNNFLIVNF
jgi:hypothetical protein